MVVGFFAITLHTQIVKYWSVQSSLSRPTCIKQAGESEEYALKSSSRFRKMLVGVCIHLVGIWWNILLTIKSI